MVIFVVLMIGAILATYFTLAILKLGYSVLIPLCVFFILGVALAFMFITFLSIQQEEVADCYKLTVL